MPKAILYPYGDHLAVTTGAPDDEAGYTQVALLVVPENVPYLVVNESDLPTDPTYFEAWTADFSQPDGIGIGKEAYYAAYPPAVLPPASPPITPTPPPAVDPADEE